MGLDPILDALPLDEAWLSPSTVQEYSDGILRRKIKHIFKHPEHAHGVDSPGSFPLIIVNV